MLIGVLLINEANYYKDLIVKGAGGGIWTHGPLRDGITHFWDLKSRVSNIISLFGQALQPPLLSQIALIVCVIKS